MITAIAIYRSPPGASKPIAVREEHVDPARGVPEWKEDPKFFDDLKDARRQVPDGYRRELPTARDRRELPLLLEVWIKVSEAVA